VTPPVTSGVTTRIQTQVPGRTPDTARAGPDCTCSQNG
jgi:hypothetical protein